MTDIWHFEVLQDTHNHEHTYNPSVSTLTRALDKTEDFKKKLVKDHQKAGIPAKSTYNTLKLNNPENSVII